LFDLDLALVTTYANQCHYIDATQT
jgi:hypothetical protein